MRLVQKLQTEFSCFYGKKLLLGQRNIARVMLTVTGNKQEVSRKHTGNKQKRGIFSFSSLAASIYSPLLAKLNRETLSMKKCYLPNPSLSVTKLSIQKDEFGGGRQKCSNWRLQCIQHIMYVFENQVSCVVSYQVRGLDFALSSMEAI